jgi:GNAT superfamily N-acetyltransferase
MVMMGLVTLRQANLCDLQLIHAIRRHAILGIESETLAERDRQEWADKRSQEFFVDRVVASEVFIAICEGDAVGWGSASGGIITGLYVLPSAALRGVGRSILLALEARLMRDGHSSASLESSPNAVHFYQRLGYVPIGSPRDDGAIPMKRALDSSETCQKGLY